MRSEVKNWTRTDTNLDERFTARFSDKLRERLDSIVCVLAHVNLESCRHHHHTIIYSTYSEEATVKIGA